MIRKVIGTYKSSFSNLSRETWVLSAVILINRCSNMAVPFMSLYVTQYLHRSTAEAGLVLGIYGVGSMLGTMAGGRFTDRFGFRQVQIFSIITSGSLFLVFSLIEQLTILYFLTFVMAFFMESFRPANITAIAAYAAPGSETRSYSFNRFATNIGWAVGSSLGGILAAINYKLLFIVDGCVSILAGLLILKLLPPVDYHARKTRQPGVKAGSPWKDRVFVRFIAVTTVYFTCFFIIFRIVPLFYKLEWHIGESLIGMILGINGIIIALFEMVIITSIEHKRSPITYIIAGVGLVALSYSLLLLPGTAPVLLAFISIVCVTLGEILTIPFINTFVMKRSDRSNRGRYAAGYSLSWAVAQCVGPLAGFYCTEQWGFRWFWVLVICLLIGCIYIYTLMGRSREMNELPPVEESSVESVVEP